MFLYPFLIIQKHKGFRESFFVIFLFIYYKFKMASPNITLPTHIFVLPFTVNDLNWQYDYIKNKD